jgi:putative ATP-dependent endonuclease of the OLD family
VRLKALRIRNYRTVEALDLAFPSTFTAICGANDSGKTNVVRAIRALMRDAEVPYYLPDEDTISINEDFTKWLSTDRRSTGIVIGLTLCLERDRDAGLFQFVQRQLKLEQPDASLQLELDVTYQADKSEPDVRVAIGQQVYGGIEAQEVLKKLRTSRAVLFHNSTEADPRVLFRGGVGQLREATGEQTSFLESLQKTVTRGMAKIAKRQQLELESLLGRLQKKYKVGMSLPSFDLSSIPFNLTLGERKFDVALDNWGSGTRNRTLILLTMFRAKQLSESEASASKVTPILVVEEPESFLHPSAQAEFGKVMQDLAAEFGIQVIVTTHSPYMLNMQEPSCNALLVRREVYGQSRETYQSETTSDDWTGPFSQALGLVGDEIKPWTDLLLNRSDSILLVEGDTDREYFELLRNPAHGNHRLAFDGDIVSYEGTGSLQNTVLLRFVKNRHRRFFVTFDLDSEPTVEKQLKALGLEKGKHYAGIGANEPGRRAIEGLLPEQMRNKVYATHGKLVDAAMNGTSDERKAARNQLKKHLLEEFRRSATPGSEAYSGLYQLSRQINRALA